MGSIKVEHQGATAVMRIDRPPANAIDIPLVTEADAVLSSIESDDAARAIVVTGTGSTFSAGLDLKVVPFYSEEEQRRLIEGINVVVTHLYSCRKPTITAANGHAIAGGFILAMCCDYRLAAEGQFRFGVTEARLGIPFPIAAIEVLKAELNPSGARTMILTGRTVGPSEAIEGAFDEVVPPERLMERAMEVADELGALRPQSYDTIKRQLRGDTVARIEQVVEAEDPLLETWMSVKKYIDDNISDFKNMTERHEWRT